MRRPPAEAGGNRSTNKQNSTQHNITDPSQHNSSKHNSSKHNRSKKREVDHGSYGGSTNSIQVSCGYSRKTHEADCTDTIQSTNGVEQFKGQTASKHQRCRTTRYGTQARPCTHCQQAPHTHTKDMIAIGTKSCNSTTDIRNGVKRASNLKQACS